MASIPPIIMSAAHHQVVGKCYSSEACESTGENSCGAKPCVVSCIVAPGVARLLLCGHATGCDKTYWHGCEHQSVSDVATLLARRIAAGGCYTHYSCATRRLGLQKLQKSELGGSSEQK